MRFGAILGALLLFASSAALADDLPVSVLQAARALNTNRDLFENLPLYTCLETITRSRAEGGRRKSKHVDVVRVDVGVGAFEEMYSWPGESAFSSRDLFTLVGHGLLSTGLFETFATNLFINRHGTARLAGEEDIDGRRAVHFTYTVPSLESKWTINWDGTRGSAGEQGDFWVDKSSYRVLRLRAKAKDISPNLSLKTLTTTIDYQFLTLNGKAALLPKQAQVAVIENNGDTFQNDAAFSGCHVFEAESRLTNSSKDLEKILTRYESRRGTLPAGLTLRISLLTAIRTGTAKIGDAVAARLNHPLKISADTIVPTGAVVHGHVRECDKLDDPPGTFAIGVDFDELEWQGRAYVFLAEIAGMLQIPGLTDKLRSRSSTTSRRRTSTDILYSTVTEDFWQAEIAGAATFYLQNVSELPAGFQMTWRTKSLAHP